MKNTTTRFTMLAALLAMTFALVQGVTAEASSHKVPSGSGHTKVCADPAPGLAGCHAEQVTDAGHRKPLATVSYTYGFAPADLVSAYNVPAGGTGQTIGIV